MTQRRAPLVVGAYPTYVATPHLMEPIVEGLAESDRVGGLELPWNGGLVLPESCPEQWRHVVTCIPGTMARLGDDATYGLASPYEDGRRRALTDLGDVREVVADLAPAIRAVEIHSSPRATASPVALAESLAEIASWDWSGAELVVEHCDAWREGPTVQKGFLSYADEAAVVSEVSGLVPVRMGINWARSVIESCDPQTPYEQIADASRRGMLGAVMFSSVSDRATAFGPAWIDAHLAPAETTSAEPGTLLTVDHVRRCLSVLDRSYDGLVGVKVGFKPDTLTAAERVARLLEVVAMIDAAA